MAARGDGAKREPWIWVLSASLVPIQLVYANYPAALPIFKAEWGLSNAEAGTIFWAFFVGYILASAVLTAATDYVNARTIFIASAAWLGLANLLFPLWAEGFWSAAALRAFTGVGLAGVYGPGLRLVADHAPAHLRTRAVSAYAFCFTFGVAASMFVTGMLVGRVGWRWAFTLASAGPALGVAVDLLAVPRLAPPRAGAEGRFELPRLPLPSWVAIGAYVFHRWEIFAFRSWSVAFFASSFMSGGVSRAAALDWAATATASMIALSSFSNLLGGWLGDRLGRTPTIAASLFVSGSTAMVLGQFFGEPPAVLLGVTLLWVMTANIDAPVFLVLITEVSPARHLGSALGLLAGLGFLLGAIAPVAVGRVLDLTNAGLASGALPTRWGWAFAVPGAAAMAGIAGTAWLARLTRGRGRGGAEASP